MRSVVRYVSLGFVLYFLAVQLLPNIAQHLCFGPLWRDDQRNGFARRRAIFLENMNPQRGPKKGPQKRTFFGDAFTRMS